MAVIIFTTKNDSWNPCPTTNATPNAVTIATTATISGMPAATAAPKIATRITSAIGAPIPSPRRRSRSEVSVNVWSMLPRPASNTSCPAGAANSSTSSMSGIAVRPASSTAPESVTGMSAVARSAETKCSSPVS